MNRSRRERRNDGGALSGLARAFFNAGARSLVVSHREVSSGDSVELMTEAVAELKADPKIGRAEALRRSMFKVTTGKSYEAHPAFSHRSCWSAKWRGEAP